MWRANDPIIVSSSYSFVQNRQNGGMTDTAIYGCELPHRKRLWQIRSAILYLYQSCHFSSLFLRVLPPIADGDVLVKNRSVGAEKWNMKKPHIILKTYVIRLTRLFRIGVVSTKHVIRSWTGERGVAYRGFYWIIQPGNSRNCGP